MFDLILFKLFFWALNKHKINILGYSFLRSAYGLTLRLLRLMSRGNGKSMSSRVIGLMSGVVIFASSNMESFSLPAI